MGGWVLGRRLGRGSTAVVHLAASTSGEGESVFAVKSAELSRSAPLRREEKMLSSLSSPHVVSCMGSDLTAEPDGRVLYHLFVEYVPGGSLAEAVRERGGLDEGAMRVYTRGILRGLAYLHGRGVVHGDVKGQNVLVGEDGTGVKLADLGCARWAGEERGGGGRGAIGGTPLYMAPEVARGEEQGPAADVWALGCTVIEMATGHPPWRDVEDPVAAIHRIAFSDDVPESPCDISDDARDFLGRCLNRDPTRRWPAEELLSHPFVRCDEKSTTETASNAKRNSPKSILDQDFWDSWPEEEEERGECQALPHMENQPLLESARERLRRLAGGRVSAAPATREESCWITVRHDVPTSSGRGGGSCWVSPEPWAGERPQFEIPAGEDEAGPSTRPWVPAGASEYRDGAAAAGGFAAINPCSHSPIVSCDVDAFVREGDDTFVHNEISPYPCLSIA